MISTVKLKPKTSSVLTFVDNEGVLKWAIVSKVTEKVVALTSSRYSADRFASTYAEVEVREVADDE